MKVEWNNCFLCLNDLGVLTPSGVGDADVNKTAQVTLLLNYLLDTKTKQYSGLISDIKELLLGESSPVVRICEKCEGQLKTVRRLHQELEVVQMKLVGVLGSVKKTVIQGCRSGSGGDNETGSGSVGLDIFEDWLREQEGRRAFDGVNLEEEQRLRQQRKILETLYGFQAGVVENDKQSIEIPRIFLDKCTHFLPEPKLVTEPDRSCSEIVVKTEAVDLNDFEIEAYSPNLQDDFFEQFIRVPPPTERIRQRKRKKALTNEVKPKINEVPKRTARASSSVARLRITEIRNQSLKPRCIKKEPSDDLIPQKRFRIPAAFSLKKLKPHSSKAKYHRSNNYYACATCDYVHRNLFSFEHHLRTHEVPVDELDSNSHKLPLYHCQKCEITFSVEQNHQFHMACHNRQIRTFCDVCNIRCEPLTLTEHMKTHLDQLEKIFPCPNCSFCCSTREKYLGHLSCHDIKSSMQECDICRKTFSSRRDLFQHYHNMHQALEELICGEDGCTKTFLDANILLAHKKLHEKKFVCQHCQMALSSKISLQVHLLKHTGEKPFACDRDNCTESFTSKVSLERHLMRYHGAPKIKCEYCNKGFSDISSLKVHTVRFHTDSEFVCEVKGCGAVCGNMRLLRRHMLSHSSERKFICEECGSGFKTVATLKKHKLIHGGEKKFKCQYCGKAFLFEKYLIPHLRIHTGEKPFVCDACGKDFNQYAALYMHKRKCHLQGKTTPSPKRDLSPLKRLHAGSSTEENIHSNSSIKFDPMSLVFNSFP